MVYLVNSEIIHLLKLWRWHHSLFSSHLLCGSQLLGHTNLTNQNKVQKLQNKALRKILFKKQQDSITQCYREFQIFKISWSTISTKLSFYVTNRNNYAITTKLNLKQNDFLIYLFLIHRSMVHNLLNITV